MRELSLPLQRWLTGWFQRVLALKIHDAKHWGIVVGATEQKIQAFATFIDDELPLSVISGRIIYDVVAVLQENYAEKAHSVLSEWYSKIEADRYLADYWLQDRFRTLQMSIQALPVRERDDVIAMGIKESRERILASSRKEPRLSADEKEARLRIALDEACREIEYLLGICDRKPGDIYHRCRDVLNYG